MSFFDLKKGHFREEVTMVELLVDQNDIYKDFSSDENSYGTPKTTLASDAYNSENPKKSYLFTDQQLRGAKRQYFPNLVSVSSNTPELSIGENIGTRASVTVRIEDFITNDAYELGSKYSDRRVTGSFWGKFTARNYIRNRVMVVYRGYLGETYDLDNFTREVYIVQDITRNKNGAVTIKGIDPLYYTNESKAKMPLKSKGYLRFSYGASATSIEVFTDEINEYGASGDTGIIRVNDEYMEYQISSLTSNIVTMNVVRGYDTTFAEEHEQEDAVQLCYVASNRNVVDVIRDAIGYTKIDPDYIANEFWEQQKSGDLADYNVTTILDKPTEVKKVIAEMIRHCGGMLNWDTVVSKIVLRGNPEFKNPDLIVNENIYEQDSVSIKELTREQVTRGTINFAKRNYVLDDKEKNYRKAYNAIDDLAESDAMFGDVSEMKTINSNWLTSSVEDTQIAARIINREISRKSEIPFETTFTIDSEYIGLINPLIGEYSSAFGTSFNTQNASSYGFNAGFSSGFSIPKPSDYLSAKRVWLGSVVEMTNHLLIAPNGDRLTYRGQITKLEPKGIDKWEVTILSISSEEVQSFDYIISEDQENITLTDIAPPIEEGRQTRVLIESNVTIGSVSTAEAALKTGNYPNGLHLAVRGRILGAGGNGGNSSLPPPPEPGVCSISFQATNGFSGGPALEVQCENVTIDNGLSGLIYGGGGGGAALIGYSGQHPSGFNTYYSGFGGGGGQGYIGGTGGTHNWESNEGEDGNIDGAGEEHTKGGEWGEAGADSLVYACGFGNRPVKRRGGSAGSSIITNGFSVFISDGNNALQVKGPIV